MSGAAMIAPAGGECIGSARRRSRDVAWLAALMALGAALRLYRLDTGLWYDEIVTLVESVRLPLGEIVSRFQGDNHHPLYSVLGHAAVAAFGEQPWALRLPSVLFGIAAIPMLFLLGTTVTNRREAGAAAAILTVSYHHIWFSQNARAYTAILFCVLLSTWALVRWFESGRRWLLVLYALGTAAGAYAHMTMVLVAVGQALACGIEWTVSGPEGRARMEPRALGLAFAGAAALTIALYAPMLADVGSVITGDGAGAGDKTSVAWAAGAALQGIHIGFGALWAVAAGAVIFAAGGLSYFRQRALVALLFSLPVAITVAAPFVLDRPLRPRFLFFALGFALLVTVRGAAAIGSLLFGALRIGLTPGRGAQLMVGLFTVGAVTLSVRSLPYGYRYPKQDYADAANFVERTKDDGDIVAVVGDGGAIPLVNYLGRPWIRIDSGADLRALRGGGSDVWVVHTFTSYIEAGQPDLWAVLERDCPALYEVDSTVEDGDITVRRCR